MKLSFFAPLEASKNMKQVIGRWQKTTAPHGRKMRVICLQLDDLHVIGAPKCSTAFHQSHKNDRCSSRPTSYASPGENLNLVVHTVPGTKVEADL